MKELPTSMRPLAELSAATAGNVVAVLTDIDDTLTEHGRLPSIAYAALEALHESGLVVIPVTGRPAGWCDLIARQWPVDAVVGENGAFWFRYHDSERRMERHFMRAAAAREDDRARLWRIAEAVLHDVPGTAIAADQSYRAVDVAIDFAEDVGPLPPAAVARIVDRFEAEGATAKVSSIHVNAWYGTHDKLTTSLALLREVFGIDGEAQRERIVFAGDSPNDAPMFGFFPNSVGVANVRNFASSLKALPGFVTPSPTARGFAELAAHLQAARANR